MLHSLTWFWWSAALGTLPEYFVSGVKIPQEDGGRAPLIFAIRREGGEPPFRIREDFSGVPELFAFQGAPEVKNLELLYRLASMSPVGQVGIKMTARVSWTQFLNDQVHGTLGGHFSFGKHSKFEKSDI